MPLGISRHEHSPQSNPHRILHSTAPSISLPCLWLFRVRLETESVARGAGAFPRDPFACGKALPL